MKRVYVDANVFLRFFTMDQHGHHGKAERLFKQAEAGEVNLVTGPPVLFEVAWTLRSLYKQSREGVLDVLSRILGMEGLELTDSRLVEDAVRRARMSGVEFADAYIMAGAEASDAIIATFNVSDFKRLGAHLHKL